MKIRLLVLLLFTVTVSYSQIVVSDFATGLDGWTTSDQDGLATYNAGGYITGNDYNVVGTAVFPVYWSFVAPAKFTGDKSAYYNGTLSFDLQQTVARTWVSKPDIVLSSGQISISYSNIIPNYPATAPGWTSYTINLSEATGKWTNTATGGIATATDLTFVLTNLLSVTIRGRYGAALSTGSLDNVKLTPFIVSSQPAATTTVCGGATVTLTSTSSGGVPPTAYQWQLYSPTTGKWTDLAANTTYSNVTGTTLTIYTSTVGAGTYRLKFSGTGENSIYSNNAVVNVNTVPGVPGLTGNTGCSGATQVLTATGGTAGQYRWYTVATGGTASTQTGATFTTPALTATTTFYVAVNNGTCESARANTKANVVAAPVVTGTTGASACGPAVLTINATGGTAGQYRWYTVATGGAASTAQTGASFITSSLSVTTTYYVAVNNGVCESARTPVVAQINTVPAAPTTTNGSRCGSGTVVLTAAGGSAGNYKWYTTATGGTAIAGATNATYTTPSISATTNYYASVINGTCEGSRSLVTAQVNTLPTAPVMTGAYACGPSAVVLIASGSTNGQYRWYSVATGGTAVTGQTNDHYTTPVISATTTFYATIYNGTCESTRAAVIAQINTVPGAPATTNGNRCGPGTVILTAAGGSAGNYKWYTTATGGTAIAGETNATYTTASIPATASYYVTIINGTCEGPRSLVTAQINTVPSPPATTDGDACGSSAVVVAATGGTNGQYRWYSVASGGTAVTGETNDHYTTPVISATTTFYATIYNGACESTRAAVTAAIIAVPSAPGVTGASSCTSASLTLTASGGTDGNYRWYTTASGGSPLADQVNSTFATPVISTTTTYYVSLLNSSCQGPRSAVVAAIISCDKPPAIATTSSTAEIDGTVTIALADLLSDPDDNIDTSSLKIIVQPLSKAKASITKDYTLFLDYSGLSFSGTDSLKIEVCDVAGLCAQQEIYVEVVGSVEVYNGISPNGDGKNDTFIIRNIQALDLTNKNRVSVFDRWGDEVFSVENYDNDVNVFKGLNKSGSELPSGTYFYKIVFLSGKKTLTGYLSLRR